MISTFSFASNTSSGYNQTINPYVIYSNVEEKVLTLNIEITNPNTPVLIQTTGSWSCSSSYGNILGYLKINGVILEGSKIYQSFDTCPTKHPFLSHAALNLHEGINTVEFYVLKSGGMNPQIDSNTFLTVFNGFENVNQYLLPTNSIGIIDSAAPVTVFSLNIPAASSNRLIEFSGSLQLVSGGDGIFKEDGGDAMTKIFVDGIWRGNYAINDLLYYQDEFAPYSNHYLVDNKPHLIELKAHRWVAEDYPNTVTFKFLPGSSIIIATTKSDDSDYSGNFFGVIPPNTQKIIGSHDFSNQIPLDILVLGEGVWLDMDNQGGGIANLWITFDGVQVGSVASQQFTHGHSISQRTYAINSLLQNVQPGNHQIDFIVATSESTMPRFQTSASIIIIPSISPLYPVCDSVTNIASATMPNSNLCSVGTVNNSFGSTTDGTNRWYWGCVGQNTDWTDDTAWCFAPKIIYPVCGSATNIASATMPNSNLCSVGTLGNSGPTGDGTNRWYWGCVGSNTDWTDDTAWCFAPKLIPIAEICSEYPSDRFSSAEFNTHISEWKNGTHSLLEILRRAKIWKHCN